MPIANVITLPFGPRPRPEYDPVFDGPKICNCRFCLVELSSSPEDRAMYGLTKLAGYVLGTPACPRCFAEKAELKPGPVKKRKR